MAVRICCSVLALRLRGPRLDWILLKVQSMPAATHRWHGGASLHLTFRILQASQERETICRCLESPGSVNVPGDMTLEMVFVSYLVVDAVEV